MNKDIIKFNSTLWSAFSAMRGAISSSDYPYVVIPALLLKWAELKNEEDGFPTYKEIYSPKRLNATYGIADTSIDIINYLVDIEEKQSKIKGGYISEFSPYLERMSEDGFKQILSIIASFAVAKSTDLYSIAREIVMTSVFSAGRISSLTMSCTGVKQIEKIALGEVNENSTIIDAFSGTGIGILDATDGKGILTLNDINVGCACIAESLCLFKGVNAVINVKDSYSSGVDENLYDAFISEPPFGLRNSDYSFENLPYYDPDMENMNVKLLLSKLKEGGKGVVLCPSGFLFRSGRSLNGRKELIEKGNIDSVILLPAGMLMGTSIPTAVVVLKKNREEKDILFVDATSMLHPTDRAKTDYVLHESDKEQLISIMTNRENVEGISKLVSLEEIASRDYSLVISQYVYEDNGEPERIDIAPLVKKGDELSTKYRLLNEELNSLRKEIYS